MKKLEKTKAVGIFKLAVFLFLMAVLTVVAGKPIVDAVKDPVAFRAWVEGCGVWGKIAFLLMIFVQTVIAFIPGEPFEIAAGYAFGAVPGMLLTIIGQMLGSVTVFLFVKKHGMKLVEVFVPREKIASMRFLKDERKLEALIFFIFLMPGTPKDALCYFVGLTPMRLGAWMLISSVARIPSVVTSTIGGNALGIGRTTLAVIVFSVTVIVSVSGYCLYTRYMAKKEKQRKETIEKRKIRKEERKEKRKKLISKARGIGARKKRVRKTGE